ncbi:SLC13/DASS family transporter [Desulfobacter hydrogenophilus]|uniref:SLC13/DASS family transporter n=1 Tax=Desulfobacter hydrogenophilus TaxID=2291 RepID=A0A328FFS9_9BACT|nr:SLC13 family permease [Desulfobacter hydrogenophilus]NDY71376.1 SLC13/DASS family transporter [Desulfobacter hydrogenophilus]QBH12226.1 SLC13/DASS family transporter [Desulfobacter hydrogenophilus]RAM03448.1 SLC13/DASS family transporter [Desulfobacter hydrogenophilus]
MMNMPILVVSLILLLTLILLISEKISVDKTAIGIMVLLALTGILTPAQAVAGFANPAVITVGAMFLLSHGLIRTGAVGFLTELVLKFSQGKRQYAFVIILTAVAVLSAFINNTPVVVLFIPIVMALSCECDFSPSKLLIPLSYVSILAGTSTLIGTSTNIIVSDLAYLEGYDQLSMFELSRLGGPIAVMGILFLFLIAPKLMPGRIGPVCELDEGKENKYIAELIVTEKSPLIGEKDITQYADKNLGLDVVELFRNGGIFDPSRQDMTIMPGDILLVKGAAQDMISCLQSKKLSLVHGDENFTFGGKPEDDLIVELIIPPLSSLLREPLISAELQYDSDIRIIAIRSRMSYFSYRKIKKVKLKIGDIILVQCPRNKLDKIRRNSDFVMIEDIHHTIIDKEKARIASGIFAAVVLAATIGLSDIMICALTGVFLMTLTHCLSLKDAYRSLQPEVLLLIIGTLALGLAMQKTGATELYAEAFLNLFHGKGPHIILFAIIFLTSVSSHVLSNNATAVLLLPIAISTAVSLGVDTRPFIIGICFGASACYASPIGYQTNLLVYGPGGYRFSDFIKLGLPLNIIVIVMSGFFIPVFWPF